MTPTLGAAFVEEEADQRPTRRRSSEASKAEKKETERANRACEPTPTPTTGARARAGTTVAEVAIALLAREKGGKSFARQGNRACRTAATPPRPRATPQLCFVCFV